MNSILKKMEDIKTLAGKGAWVMMQRSFKEEIKDEITKKEMTKEFLDFYSKNIDKHSVPIKGVIDFLKWAKNKKISMAVCTNKQEHLAINLLKEIKIYDYFEYVAGSNTFDYCKPDPRHLTNVIEIMQGDIKKSIMIGDSETDAESAKAAKIPFILLEDGYTDKKVSDIHHDYLIKNFDGIEEIINKYLID